MNKRFEIMCIAEIFQEETEKNDEILIQDRRSRARDMN